MAVEVKCAWSNRGGVMASSSIRTALSLAKSWVHVRQGWSGLLVVGGSALDSPCPLTSWVLVAPETDMLGLRTSKVNTLVFAEVSVRQPPHFHLLPPSPAGSYSYPVAQAVLTSPDSLSVLTARIHGGYITILGCALLKPSSETVENVSWTVHLGQMAPACTRIELCSFLALYSQLLCACYPKSDS